MKTGAPYGQVFDAVDRGCKGGDTNVAGTGGRGGGVIFIQVTGILQKIIAKTLDLYLLCGEVYSIQYYVIKFVSDLQQVGGFLQVLRFPSPIKLTTTI
jgi:hypothetical protein